MSLFAVPQFENYAERQQADFLRAPTYPQQEWPHQQTPAGRPPASVDDLGESGWESLKRSGSGSHPRNGLDQTYVMESRRAVLQFIEENRLHGLLVQAKTPLNKAFTESAMKMLSVVRDEEGFETLFCLVMVSGDMQLARQSLREFDEQWWLAHSNQAAGKLNFDFELV